MYIYISSLALVFEQTLAKHLSYADLVFLGKIEVRAHDDNKLWPDVEDPATQHPMSARLVQILETYKRMYKETGKEQPLLKNARYGPKISTHIIL